MIKIKEIGTNGKGSKIMVEKDINGNITSYQLKTKVYKTFSSNGLCFSLVDRIGNPIVTAIDFITSPEIKVKANNTKEKNLIHISILYKFLDAFDKTIDELVNDKITIIRLLHFISKADYQDNEVTMNFTRVLSYDTRDSYFITILAYLKFLGYQKECLIFKENMHKYVTGGVSVKKRRKKGILDSNNSLTPIELGALINEAKDTSKVFYTGVRLLFETGMRIGTMLGLTEEDLFYDTDEDGNILRYYVKARNRFSDKSFQSVKNLPKIYSPTYKPGKPDVEGIDFFKYPISYTLYLSIQEIIELNYKNSKKDRQKKENYTAKSIANRYYHYIPLTHKDNHYIFLNNQCKPMSDLNWNKTFMRPAFDKLNINRDIDVKQHGLNHLIRHTAYTFLCIKGVLSTDGLKLMFLKNKAPDTLNTYFSPNSNMIDTANRVLTDTFNELTTNVNKVQKEIEGSIQDSLEEMAGDL